MEATGSKFNPHNLKFPRNLKDGSPYFWRTDITFTDTDWEFHNSKFYIRYRTWSDECDRAYETKESLATLFLLFAVWWLRTGGKCYWFGFRFVYFTRHLQNYSFGRGVYRLDTNGAELTISPIRAGDPMDSSFSTVVPRDMYTDFDFTKVTMVVESWRANVVRYTYLVQVYPELRETLRKIAPATPWYHPIKSINEYNGKIPTLGSWRGKVLEVEEDDDEEEAILFKERMVREDARGLDRLDETED